MDASIIYSTPILFCFLLCCCITCLKMFYNINYRRKIVPTNLPSDNRYPLEQLYVIVENPDDTISIFRRVTT